MVAIRKRRSDGVRRGVCPRLVNWARRAAAGDGPIFQSYSVLIKVASAQALATSDKEAKKGWSEFAVEGAQKGARAAHRFSKEPAKFTLAVDASGKPLRPVEAMDAEVATWGGLWCKGAHAAIDLAGVPELPRPSVGRVRKASWRFPEYTGLGWDAFHARWLAYLSDEDVEWLIDIMMEVGRTGCLPK